MPVTTLSAAIHITPVVAKTFFRHGKRKAQKYKDSIEQEDPQDDIFFDEAFHIVKAFIELGTKNTIESLQHFTNTHVPAPYWAAVSPVRIPLSSCNAAADILIDWFGPDDLKHVVGGERWWQVRGLDGVDGEWITEKDYLSSEKPNRPNGGEKGGNGGTGGKGEKMNADDERILRMEHLDKVMLYVHGGGYFWGSINTHRYQIIRYARKIKGRAFAVNYRKAPQYPWPCPLQDVIAAYLYLIHPPPTALHTAVPASSIVFAGDSAGGGLCLAALSVLRDMGIEMPAGAVLISPWVDLTHSFGSIIGNTETDIVPEHGFLAKPSTLWPVDPHPPPGGRAQTTEAGTPPKPGHADVLRPSAERVEEDKDGKDGGVKPQKEMLDDMGSSTAGTPEGSPDPGADEYDLDVWEPKPPKVLMDDPNAIPLQLNSQIQVYAATEQLTHPLVSPILQGSLGNLPPLYIIAGDGEMLRDEAIYIAHKAAHPQEYPTRAGVLRDGRRQKENAEKFTEPTKVHLQVFDGMCHVLTVFTFTSSAKYAYRSIAEFVKHVTSQSAEHLERNPFPELHRPPSNVSTSGEASERKPTRKAPRGEGKESKKKSSSSALADKFSSVRLKPKTKPTNEDKVQRAEETPSDVRMYKEGIKAVEKQVEEGKVETIASPTDNEGNEEDEKDGGKEEGSSTSTKEPVEADSSGTPSPREQVKMGQDDKDISNVLMIRERVSIHGLSRPMEPASEIPALQLHKNKIGIIKEAPTRSWLTGQDEWDRRYKRSASKVVKQRAKMEAKAKKMMEHAREQGLVLTHEEEEGGEDREGEKPPFLGADRDKEMEGSKTGRGTESHKTRTTSNATASGRRGSSRATARETSSVTLRSTTSEKSIAVDGIIQTERRWGPLDLEDERPPPSAIAKRRDTPEALALLKTMIYHTAPVTHQMVPKLKAMDAVRAAFDINDDPNKAPQMSASEQQVKSHLVPMHGLRIWDALVGYFARESSKQATAGAKQAAAAMRSTGEAVGLLSKTGSHDGE